MTTKLIKIGNSRGIVIPSSILKEMELKEKDNLLIHTEEHRLCSIARKGIYRDTEHCRVIYGTVTETNRIIDGQHKEHLAGKRELASTETLVTLQTQMQLTQ